METAVATILENTMNCDEVVPYMQVAIFGYVTILRCNICFDKAEVYCSFVLECVNLNCSVVYC